MKIPGQQIPEVTLAFYGLVSSLVLELAHSALYVDHGRGVAYVLWTRIHCSVGDVIILLGVFWWTSLLFNSRNWFAKNSRLPATLFVLSGLAYTIWREWLINDRPWTEHQSLKLRHGEMHRLRFVNRSFRLHPMHIHGLFFKLIARNGKPVNEPHWRDTILIWPEEVVDVGVVPLDKGRWLTHCHIQEHAEGGMKTLVEVE